MPFIAPLALMGAMGTGIGIVILIASKKLAVAENPLVEEIAEALPGSNCGACGYPGCRGLAEALAADPDLEATCPVGGETVANEVARILGVERKVAEKKVARLMCGGTVDCASRIGIYEGIEDCALVEYSSSATKVCTYGCLGLGTCARACPFEAIELVDGVIRIDEAKCTGCGVCVEVCPRDCIELMGANRTIWVACHSQDKGAQVRKICKVGCIGCKKCEKNCPTGAIKVENFYAHIDQTLCSGCGKCAELCPTTAIVVRGRPERLIAQAAAEQG